MDEQISMNQEVEQTVQNYQKETQEQQTNFTPEKVNALQKFINGLFGGSGNKETDVNTSKNREYSDTTHDEVKKTFTQAELDAAIEAAKQKWIDDMAEKERVKKLTPEEKAAEEQKKSADRIAELEGRLKKKELREIAIKVLEKDGFPVGLANLLNYSNQEDMEKSLKDTTEIFKSSLAVAIQTRLKGKTPEGLGGAASSQNLLRDQIAKNIRGL